MKKYTHEQINHIIVLCDMIAKKNSYVEFIDDVIFGGWFAEYVNTIEVHDGRLSIDTGYLPCADEEDAKKLTLWRPHIIIEQGGYTWDEESQAYLHDEAPMEDAPEAPEE